MFHHVTGLTVYICLTGRFDTSSRHGLHVAYGAAVSACLSSMRLLQCSCSAEVNLLSSRAAVALMSNMMVASAPTMTFLATT